MKPSSETLKPSRAVSVGRSGVMLEFLVALPYLFAAAGLWEEAMFPLYPIGLALLLPSGVAVVCALTAPGSRCGRHPLLATLALANVVLGAICWFVLSHAL